MLYAIQVGIVIAGLAIAGYFAFDAYRLYRNATGSLWERLIAAGKGSATILWQRFVVVVTAIVGALSQFADVIGDPSLGTAIQSALKPEYVAAFTIGVALITVLARKRTM